jgi:hypothetical protein
VSGATASLERYRSGAILVIATFLFAATIINSCGNIVSYFLSHDALRSTTGAIISATFLFFLCRHSVRNYFLRQALIPNHKP